MLKVSDAILKKVYNCLVKMYHGDRTQIRKAIETIVTNDRSWNSDYQKILQKLAKAIDKKPNPLAEPFAIQACKQIRDPWDNETTEKTLPAKTQSTTEKTYTQLTLDFSATTETPNAAATSPDGEVGTRRSPRWQQEEQLICQKFNGKREKKGWLAPQYKYFDECGRSHTTTDPDHVSAVKIYGPYWTYRWASPGKNYDGNFYLGATSSRKFQHFSVVWEQCGNSTEILEWLGKQ